jgi:peptidoglycan hydrolase-like protein with peptidoglycan-binding domain
MKTTIKKVTPKSKAGTTKKANKKKVVLATISVAAAGVLGYFGWQYYKKKKEGKSENAGLVFKPTTEIPAPVYNPMPTRDTPVWKTTPIKQPRKSKVVNENAEDSNNDFPLRKGSKGEKVTALQEALIAKHGKAIMPRYGADGFFGAELLAALRKLKLPASINETTYNVLVQGHTTSKSTTAQKLYNAAVQADFKTAIALLKTIKSKDDYQEVSTQFKIFRVNGVRQTLVNGMLNVFNKEAQKQAIRFEFIRMGLQYDGNKWSLSGLGGLPIITNQETTVWVNATNGLKVKPKTVLGNEISKRLDYTLFENNGKYFLVRSSATTYL